MKPSLATTKKRQTRTSGPVRFPGIVEMARKLGVTRVHLWLVLSHQRASKKLMRKYRELKREEVVAK